MPPPAEGFASRLFLGPALRTQPDRRLVTLVREGYETAFEEIVRRYGRPLTRYAASIVGSRSEDVTQDAFSKALLALRRDDAEIELRPWLFRIVRNAALNDLRDSPPSPEVLAEAIAGGRNPAEELERREELTDLIKRLQALPEPQRAAIVMRELEGLSHEEIATALGLSGGAARQAIYRARRALRDGAGILVPLPLLQALLVGSGSGAAEAAAGAAGIGSAAGAGVALKATAATVLVAGAVGAGVAIKDSPRNEAKATPVQASQSRSADTASIPTAVIPNASRDGGGGGGSGEDGPGRREGESGDDHGGHGREPGDDHGGHGRQSEDGHRRGGDELDDDRSGSEHGGGRGAGSGHGSGSDDSAGSGSGSGHGGGSGSGRGGSGSSDDSGSGSGGSGSSGSGGGSGPSDDLSGGDEEPIPSEEPPVDDGSGSSGSGSGSSSGSGSGDESDSGDDHSGGSD
jgi:RNA polymerase sigma factor (sigma-70 family)